MGVDAESETRSKYLGKKGETILEFRSSLKTPYIHRGPPSIETKEVPTLTTDEIVDDVVSRTWSTNHTF